MLIMPSSDINFQALAENVVKGFFVDGIPLSDGVVKVAREQSLTPEEIKRLVEKANTAASLHLLKTAEDKKGTFALAQTEMILQQTHPARDEEAEEKTASVYTGLPIQKQLKTRPVMEKAASVQQDDSCPDITTVFTLRKALDEHKLQKVALEQKIQERIDYLASEFNTWNGPDFAKFAAECMAVYGSVCIPVVQGLARYLRVEGPDLEKAAADLDDVIDDTTPHMEAMRQICHGLGESVKLARDIAELEAAERYFMDSLKEAARQ